MMLEYSFKLLNLEHFPKIFNNYNVLKIYEILKFQTF